jgi:hypothetical protein
MCAIIICVYNPCCYILRDMSCVVIIFLTWILLCIIYMYIWSYLIIFYYIIFLNIACACRVSTPRTCYVRARATPCWSCLAGRPSRWTRIRALTPSRSCGARCCVVLVTCDVMCCAVMCCAVLWCTVLCCAALCCDVCSGWLRLAVWLYVCKCRLCPMVALVIV